jgi:hypothetical protein
MRVCPAHALLLSYGSVDGQWMQLANLPRVLTRVVPVPCPALAPGTLIASVGDSVDLWLISEVSAAARRNPQQRVRGSPQAASAGRTVVPKGAGAAPPRDGNGVFIDSE